MNSLTGTNGLSTSQNFANTINRSGYRGPRGETSRNEHIPKGFRGGQIQNFTPQMMELFQQLFGQVSPDSYLSRLSQGDEELFEEMEAPAMRQFNELLGGIASRFSGNKEFGDFGARRSSGFQNTTSAAASNFAQDLASKRQGLQRQATMDLSQIAEMLLGQRPTEKYLTKKNYSPSTGEQILGGVGSFLGGVGGGFGMQAGKKLFGG